MEATINTAMTDEEAQARRQITGFGFYLYLLSDAILFAVLFATFAVLRSSTNGGPSGHEILGLPTAFFETACLLTSSLACGIAMLATDLQRKAQAVAALSVTLFLGAIFLALELSEFARLISEGFGPGRSAFLSAFFTLVSTHGLHVTGGLLWLAFMIAQLQVKGFTPGVVRRLVCFSLFWHVIDIVWIGVFTFVYLVGSRP